MRATLVMTVNSTRESSEDPTHQSEMAPYDGTCEIVRSRLLFTGVDIVPIAEWQAILPVGCIFDNGADELIPDIWGRGYSSCPDGPVLVTDGRPRRYTLGTETRIRSAYQILCSCCVCLESFHSFLMK